MTDSEQQKIIDAVLLAISSNSKTIDQLAPASSVTDADTIELGNGLRANIAQISSHIKSSLPTGGRISQSQIDSLNTRNSSGIYSVGPYGSSPTIAVLIVLVCWGGNVVQQMLLSYYPIDEDGNIDLLGTHDDNGRFYVAKRLYNISRDEGIELPGGETVAKGQWSRWSSPAGEAGGIAPLDGQGLLPASHSVDLNDLIVYFDRYDDAAAGPIQHVSFSTAPRAIRYNAAAQCFYGEYEGLNDTSVFANNWADASARYGVNVAQGLRPYANRVYVCRSSGNAYYYDTTTQRLTLLGFDAAKMATAESAGLMSAEDKVKLADLPSAAELALKAARRGKLFRFDRVVWNDSRIGPDEVGCSGGELVLFLTEAGLVESVRVAIRNESWVTLPLISSGLLPDGFKCDGERVELKVSTGAVNIGLQRDALFYVPDVRHSAYNGSEAPAGLAMLFYVDANYNLLPLGPQAQASRNGDAGHYVYSVDNPESKMSVLNAPDTFVRQLNGRLMMQKGIWNPEGASVYYSRNVIPGATTGADGVLTKEVFSRLGTGAAIYEGNATLTTVPVNYPNWADGGVCRFTLHAATSARAGVMTAEDKKRLTSLWESECQPPLIETDEVTIVGGNALYLTDQAKRAVFDDLWASYGGSRKGEFYSLHGLDDITYQQALAIVTAGRCISSTIQEAYIGLPIRTHLPRIGGGQAANARQTFRSCTKLESVQMPNLILDGHVFYGCTALRRVNDLTTGIYNLNPVATPNFVGCVNLEELRGVIQGNYSFSLADSPKLSLESFQYMIQRAKNTQAITITVHADVYAKLIDEANADWHKVLTDALDKQISFATTTN